MVMTTGKKIISLDLCFVLQRVSDHILNLRLRRLQRQL